MNQLYYDLNNVAVNNLIKNNKLNLNLNKTKFMNISNKRIAGTPLIMMDGEILKEVSEMKYLDVIFNSFAKPKKIILIQTRQYFLY